MRPFTSPTVFTIALFGAQVYAGPMEPHMIAKRDNVCALNLRGAVAKDCLDNGKGTFFSLTPPSTITSSSVTAIPDDSQCDHILELQLLDGAMNKNGLCALITQMQAAAKAAKTTVSKAALLQPLSDIVNDHKNLNFLASSVNNRKKTVVGRSIKGTPQTSEDLDKAVGNYLEQTKTPSTSIATQLDTKVAGIITKAQDIAKALPADSGTGRKKVTTKADLEKAIAVANAKKDPVATAWNKVLTDAS